MTLRRGLSGVGTGRDGTNVHTSSWHNELHLQCIIISFVMVIVFFSYSYLCSCYTIISLITLSAVVLLLDDIRTRLHMFTEFLALQSAMTKVNIWNPLSAQPTQFIVVFCYSASILLQCYGADSKEWPPNHLLSFHAHMCHWIIADVGDAACTMHTDRLVRLKLGLKLQSLGSWLKHKGLTYTTKYHLQHKDKA
jgi:hypothetical protein